MAADIGVTVTGIDDVAKAIREIPQELRKKVLLSALRKAGNVVRNAARAAAPVLSAPLMRKGAVIRKPGTVRDAISVRTSKVSRKQGNVGVFVGVRPAAGAKYKTRTTRVLGARIKTRRLVATSKRGANSPNDPYYWWWVEFGHKYVPPSSSASGGVTVYSQRLRNGRIVTRRKKWSGSSITGRRRNAVKHIAPRPFLEPAAKRTLPQALTVFKQSIGPAIAKFNKRKP